MVLFQFIGYNFFADGDALNNAPSSVDGVNNIKISNAIFDHFNITRDTTPPTSTTPPDEWTYDTIFDADFNGNVDAGNVDFLVEQVSSIQIRRRIVGEFEWLTLKTIPINTIEDLNFVFNDLLNQYGVEYEYAIVPIMEDVEADYEQYITNKIFSEFNGVFIGDAENIYKFLYEVEYNNNQRNQQVGVFQVLGNKYPVLVANGALSYETGSVSATILNDDYEKTRVLDYAAIRQKMDVLKDFLTNRKAKILKDWRGNMWLCIVNSNINVSYKQGSGMGIPTVTFDWTQVGDAFNQDDLVNNGVLKAPGVI